MTLDENLALRDHLGELGFIIDTFNNNGSKWAASKSSLLEWEDSIKHWYNITIVDCSYADKDFIKYRIKLEDKFFNDENSFIAKPIKDCTVEEVMKQVNELDLMYKKWKLECKMARLENDFR